MVPLPALSHPVFVFTNKTFFILRSRGEDFENSDWFAWLYPSRYTAAYVFSIVMMALGVVLMRVHVNRNFFENDLVCPTLFLKTEGRNISFCKYRAMCKCGLSPHTNVSESKDLPLCYSSRLRRTSL